MILQQQYMAWNNRFFLQHFPADTWCLSLPPENAVACSRAALLIACTFLMQIVRVWVILISTTQGRCIHRNSPLWGWSCPYMCRCIMGQQPADSQSPLSPHRLCCVCYNPHRPVKLFGRLAWEKRWGELHSVRLRRLLLFFHDTTVSVSQTSSFSARSTVGQRSHPASVVLSVCTCAYVCMGLIPQ